jgi:hypothetical protein
MTAVSRKLIETADGALWLVQGNPDTGYSAHELTVGPGTTFRRSWQAVGFCHGDPAKAGRSDD